MGLCILPRIPNQTRTFIFCLAPASRVDDLAFPLTPVLSTARLGTCASPNWSPDLASLYEELRHERTSHDNASRGVTLWHDHWMDHRDLGGHVETFSPLPFNISGHRSSPWHFFTVTTLSDSLLDAHLTVRCPEQPVFLNHGIQTHQGGERALVMVQPVPHPTSDAHYYPATR